MKYLVLTCSLITALSCSAQEANATIESSGGDILFRGYQNKVTVKFDDNQDKELRLVGSNLTMKKDDSPLGYILTPGNDGRIATLHVLLVDGVDVDTVESVSYRIQNLPDPNIYWGNVPNQGKANIKATELSIRYPKEVPLPNEYMVVAWETSYKGKSISGKGHDISSANEFLKTIPSGSNLIFKVTVIGPDKITRVRNVSWTVDSWSDEGKMNPLKFDR